MQIRYHVDYTVRIMDNIMSNIVKYADPTQPIVISQTEVDEGIGFIFQKKIAHSEETAEGTGVGIQSIQSMMKEIGGMCRYEYKDTRFWLEILFPIVGAGAL